VFAGGREQWVRLALLAAGALDVVATWHLASAMGTANDLFPRWYGARAWLLGGLDPYGPAVDSGIRQAMGGAPGEALGAFVFGFVYPGYVALLIAPLALLPFQAAATLWLLLAQAGIGAGTALAWRARAAETGGLSGSTLPALLVALAFPGSLANLVFGQFAALAYLSLALAWWLAIRRREVPAGVTLVFAAVKPSLALLPVLALLAWAMAAGRRRMVAAWATATGVLLAASLLALPAWPQEFLHSTREYARVAGAVSASGLLANLVLSGRGEPWPALLTPAISLLACLAIATGWRQSSRRAGDALAAGILAGAWLVPPLYEWNSVLLLVPLVQWLEPVALRSPGEVRGPKSNVRRRRVCGFHDGFGIRCDRRSIAATALLCAAGVATLVAALRWPYGSRLLWPAIALAGWALRGRYLGTQKVTARAASSPSVPAIL
jgi:hypothetical protein